MEICMEEYTDRFKERLEENMKKTIFLLLALLFLGSVMIGCITTSKYAERDVSGLDRRLDSFTYMEEGDLITLCVSTYATRFHEEDKYIPVEIAVANRSLNNLTLTRESFTLIDEAGNRYSLVPSKELLENYDKQDFDRRFGHILSVVLGKFDLYQPVDSNFEPERMSARIVYDKVELPKFSWTADMLYFDKPKTGLKGKKFELFLTAKELAEPVFVKFMVE